MGLFDTYVEYRSGNKAAYDRLFTDRVTGLGSKDYYSSFEINVQELNQLVSELYQKCSKVSYAGNLEDMKKDVALIIFQLFSDDMFAAHSEKELYEKIRQEISQAIN